MNEERLSLIITGQISAQELSIKELRFCLVHFNDQYRAGTSVVTDDRYDHEFKDALAILSAEDELLTRIEPELEGSFGDLPSVRHLHPMLSTDNAFDGDAIQKFINSIQREANELGIKNVQFKATGKLDGWAANDVNNVIATRGDGINGTEISHIIERGVTSIGGRNLGAGEIIIEKAYFDENLSDNFACGRNFLSSVIKASTPNDYALQALADGACHLVPYNTLTAWTGDGSAFMADYEGICDQIYLDTPYELDGVILEAVDADVKQFMGATSHHHRWMIAIKLKRETSIQTITDIEWTTGRSGVVTPTAIYDTVFLSGGNLSRALAHNARRVLDWGIGVGGEAEVCRSGSVIPKLTKIIKKAEQVHVPSECPSCNHALVWKNNKDDEPVSLFCSNGSACSAQVERGLFHFFNIMGNVDAFGAKSLEKIVKGGFVDLPAIFNMTHDDFVSTGFGQGEAKRLIEQLTRCQTEVVEDWRFLASFGIHTLGRGDSRKLLEVYPLETLNTLTVNDIISIHGFSGVTAGFIVTGLRHKWTVISSLLKRGFNLERTATQSSSESPIEGKFIVFTGAMQQGSRDEMAKQARALGATVQSSINSKSEYLVMGERVGQLKLDSVTKFNSKGADIQNISEADYMKIIGSSSGQGVIEYFNTANTFITEEEVKELSPLPVLEILSTQSTPQAFSLTF